MSKLKDQRKFKDRMTKLIKEKILAVGSFGIHLTFGLWNLDLIKQNASSA
jgi:hypothetical protein